MLEYIGLKRKSVSGSEDTSALRICEGHLLVVGVLPHNCEISFTPEEALKMRDWLNTTYNLTADELRAERIKNQAIMGLVEYYRGLKDHTLAQNIKDILVVPNTGNDQNDYENVRDQVETAVRQLLADLL